MQIIALIGASASGKSALGLALAREFDIEIFSLDSLSIYKYIDIASAKPNPSELNEITHYAINVLEPNEKCSVMTFWNLLTQAIKTSKQKGKRALLIVGGSSFYLKSMVDGLSPMPKLNDEVIARLKDISNPFAFLQRIDSAYCANISPNDTYRIHKAIEIYFATNTIPTAYFATHKKIAMPELNNLRIFVLQMPREILKNRIMQRTKQMLKQGLIDEVAFLSKNYCLDSQVFKAIGIKETLDFLKLTTSQRDENALCNLIATHTAQLAKRQTTFNRTQFSTAKTLPLDSLTKELRQTLQKIL